MKSAPGRRVTRSLIYAVSVSLLIFFALFFPGVEAASPARACERCGMEGRPADVRFSVSDTRSMQPVFFDDIQCAVRWWNEECATRQMSFESNALVHDYYSGEEVRLTEAFYIIDPSKKTPMGSGILAFRGRESANRFISENGRGKILMFPELTRQVLKQRR